MNDRSRKASPSVAGFALKEVDLKRWAGGAYFLIFKNFTANPSRFDQTTLPLILAVLAFFNGSASIIICPE